MRARLLAEYPAEFIKTAVCSVEYSCIFDSDNWLDGGLHSLGNKAFAVGLLVGFRHSFIALWIKLTVFIRENKVSAQVITLHRPKERHQICISLLLLTVHYVPRSCRWLNDQTKVLPSNFKLCFCHILDFIMCQMFPVGDRCGLQAGQILKLEPCCCNMSRMWLDIVSPVPTLSFKHVACNQNWFFKR